MAARVMEIQRSIERLKGIMLGIAIDGRVNGQELEALSGWLTDHQALTAREPFSTVADIIHDILEDGVIDEEEHEEIMDLCWMFDDDSLVLDHSEAVIGSLHGFLQAISSDGEISENEVIGLKNWLEVHSHAKEYWPVCEAWNITHRILADGVVDENEKQELLEFCKDFSERPIRAPVVKDEIYKERFMKTSSPIVEPVRSICDCDHKIRFRDKTFCFTGPAKTGKRSDLQKIVTDLGGIPKNKVIQSLDYLVIGAQSSPAWRFATYGRKIESVQNLQRQNKSETVILFEDDFIDQANFKQIGR